MLQVIHRLFPLLQVIHSQTLPPLLVIHSQTLPPVTSDSVRLFPPITSDSQSDSSPYYKWFTDSPPPPHFKWFTVRLPPPPPHKWFTVRLFPLLQVIHSQTLPPYSKWFTVQLFPPITSDSQSQSDSSPITNDSQSDSSPIKSDSQSDSSPYYKWSTVKSCAREKKHPQNICHDKEKFCRIKHTFIMTKDVCSLRQRQSKACILNWISLGLQ